MFCRCCVVRLLDPAVQAGCRDRPTRCLCRCLANRACSSARTNASTNDMPPAQVVLLCLSNRLDFFPLPVWHAAEDPSRPWSPSWLWARGASRWLAGRADRSGGSSGGGFRVEEAGDDFFLISYATPEGWRCAVEVHRFLVSCLVFCLTLWLSCLSFATAL